MISLFKIGLFSFVWYTGGDNLGKLVMISLFKISLALEICIEDVRLLVFVSDNIIKVIGFDLGDILRECWGNE